MIDKVRRFVSDNSLIDRKDRIILSLSGGPDSTALLHILLELKNEMDFELRAFHLNHMLRGAEADGDEMFCRELCLKAGIKIHAYKEDILLYARENRLSTETAGRKRRYELIGGILQKESFNKAATAHNLDDSVESVLMNIFRGTGLNGLCGIPARRGAIIRPLLCARKAEILEFLRSSRSGYRIDRTNEESGFLRNHIRNDILIAAGERFNTDIIGNMSRMMKNLSEDEGFINEAVDKAFEENVKTSEGTACIRKKALRECRPSVGKRLILRAVEYVKGDTVDIEQTHISSVIGLAGKRSGSGADLPGRIRAELEFDNIWIRRSKEEDTDPERAVKIRIGEETEFGGKRFAFEKKEKSAFHGFKREDSSVCLDLDRIGDRELLLRHRQEGDVFSPLKRNVTKKLKKYLIESKVPASERDSAILLAAGNEILWIAGRDVSGKYAAGMETKKFLLCEYFERRPPND